MLNLRFLLSKKLNSNIILKLFDGNFLYNTLNSYSYNHIVLFYNLYLSNPLNFRALRLVFGLPVNGQKSRSNNKTNKRTQSSFFLNKFYYFKKIFPKTNQQLFKAEYVNLFWQCFFRISWKKNKNSLKKVKGNSKYIEVSSLNMLSLIDITKKSRANRKKVKFSNKRKNLGFSFGFTKKFRSKLIALI